MSDVGTPALSIGAMAGGTSAEARRWNQAVMALARRIMSRREGVVSPLNVNIVYQIPGEVLQIDFTGVRTGRYSAAKRLLLVQAAVPAEFTPNADDIIFQLLRDAIDEAGKYALKRHLSDSPLRELKALVEIVIADS